MRSMKAVVGRVRKLEIRLGTINTAPSAVETILAMLAAGDWESVLKRLERGVTRRSS